MSKPITDLDELREDFRGKARELFHNLITYANKKDSVHNYWIIETYRPQSRQDELYAQGRTTKGNIVTYAKHSKHTDRIAVDIAVTKNGSVDYDTSDRTILSLYNQIGVECKALGLIWGGDFKAKDLGHIEMEK